MAVPGYETAPNEIRLLPDTSAYTAVVEEAPARVRQQHCRMSFNFRVCRSTMIAQMFAVMAEAADKRGHIFQILTKRPGRAVAWWERYQHQFPRGWPPNICDRDIGGNPEIRTALDGLGSVAGADPFRLRRAAARTG